MKCYRCGEVNEPTERPADELAAECIRHGWAVVTLGSSDPSTETERVHRIVARCAEGWTVVKQDFVEEHERLVFDLQTARADLERYTHGPFPLDPDHQDTNLILAEVREDLDEANAKVEELRAELRRYQPSGDMMFKGLDLIERIGEAAKVFLELQAKEGVVTEDGRTQVTQWLDRHWKSLEPVTIREPERTILALHTTIDEGRRILDEVKADYEAVKEHHSSTTSARTWEMIDEWRTRVLVKEARETVSGEVARLKGVVNEVLYRASDAESHAKALAEDVSALRRERGDGLSRTRKLPTGEQRR